MSIGRLVFAPAIDLDKNPASNPAADQVVPVIDLAEHMGSVLMLAAQLEPDAAHKVPIGVPVTFRVWRDDVLLLYEQSVPTDAWASASVEVPVAGVTGQFSYQASARNTAKPNSPLPLRSRPEKLCPAPTVRT